MKFKKIIWAYVSFTISSTTPALAAPDETVTVYGLSPKIVLHEIRKMASGQWDAQLARWDSAFCPGVLGLDEPFQGIVLKHLDRAARAVIPGLPATCKTKNAFIVFSENGSAMFDAIDKGLPTLGNGYDSSNVSKQDFEPPDRRIVAQLRQDRPVRWYRSTSVQYFNGAWGDASAQSAKFDEKGTLLRTTFSIVIVDRNLASGASWGQLADYVAFVVLAAPALGENFNQNSIMSLYDEGRFQSTAPSLMTPLDDAVLRALYAANPAQDAHAEQTQIAASVSNDVTLQTRATH
ncbi:hypothetical protein J2D73_06580 [Acetobacter sacchari]|uniref:Uncharacterized protein n=1 Tax=Acetobacter sacchari TaxID=2661687 RepID=A0ABS3LU72_9PROT|nr:hypothetical protein [Acetobacter sacchari]MBO1359462.1 hypothetical protein [Acetobacter sacchari]